MKHLRKMIPRSLRTAYRRLRAQILSLGIPRGRTFVQPHEEAEASGEVSVIVPVNDAPRVTWRCLNSLEMYAPRAEVIIVDDGSQIEVTLEMLQEFALRNNWRVVRHPKRRGHSRACEAGAKLATRNWLCLLNSDTVVTPWSWRGIKEAFEADQGIAAAGPSTSIGARLQVIPRAMYCRHYWADDQIFAFAQRYVASQPQHCVLDVPRVGGFAFFIRRNVWDELGGFDPNLPDYGNETELCKRIIARGFRIVRTPNSYIHHLGGQSYAVEGESAVFDKWARACEYINKKHGSL